MSTYLNANIDEEMKEMNFEHSSESANSKKACCQQIQEITEHHAWGWLPKMQWRKTSFISVSQIYRNAQSFDPTVEKTGDGEGVYDSYHGDYGFDKNDAQGGPFAKKFILTTMKDQHRTRWTIWEFAEG